MSLVVVAEQDERAHIPSPHFSSSTDNSTNAHNQRQDGQETEPLIPHHLQRHTPLPKLQLFAVYFIQFCEPITAVVIYPFAPELVRRTGITRGDEKKTGYYTGIIESIFMLAEVLTVYSWASLSNTYGRRPILLVAPLGLALAMLGFGLSSESYGMLVLFRCLQGVFNGNVGVSKSVIAELTDASNIGDAIALTPLMWSTGEILGPAIGGLLSNPSQKWPSLFGDSAGFWGTNPYFLPCAVAGCIALFAFLFGFLVLRETCPAVIAKKKLASPSFASSNPQSYGTITNRSESDRESSRPETPLEEFDEKAPSLSELLSLRQIQFTLAANALYYFCDASYVALIPLMYSTSIPNGGLGLSPNQIGLILVILGLWAALVNAFVLNKLIKRWGCRSMFIVSLSCLTIAMCLFPVLSAVAREVGRVDWKVASLIIVQLGFGQMVYVAYACIQVLVVESAPSNSALAATNSLAQMVSVSCRALGPWLATSLFSLSLENRLFGGQFVYVILFAIDILCVYIGFYLPKRLHRLESER